MRKGYTPATPGLREKRHPLAPVIARLDGWLQQYRPEYHAQLLPGLNDEQLQSFEEALGLALPGGMRELHWHPNADEWQYYIKGEARMTVFNTGPAAQTADFRAGDLGYIKKSLGHYIENTGTTDLVFMEIFRTDKYEEVSLADWLAHTPPAMVAATLNIDPSILAKFPKTRPEVVPV